MSKRLEDEARRRKEAAFSPPLPVGSRPRFPTGKLAWKLVNELRKDPARSLTVQELVEATKAPKSHIKKELCRLLLAGKDGSPPPVQRTGRGLYACFLGPAELARIEEPEPKVHALQLTWKGESSPLCEGFPPRSPPGVLDAGFGVLRARGSWAHDEASRSWRCVRHEGLHEITLQAFPTTGTLMASVGSSEAPLDGPGLARLRVWLQATFAAEGFRWSDPLVSTVEINRDFKRLRLTGVDAARFYLGRMGLSGETLRLEALEGAVVQVYNKRDVLRMEVRVQPRSMDLQSLTGLLVGFYYGPREGSQDGPGLREPEGGYS